MSAARGRSSARASTRRQSPASAEDNEYEEFEEIVDVETRREVVAMKTTAVLNAKVPFAVAASLVIATAGCATAALGWHARETALALASARVSSTSVDLGPATRRIRVLEEQVEALQRNREDGRKSAERVVREAERAFELERVEWTTKAEAEARKGETRVTQEIKAVAESVSALTEKVRKTATLKSEITRLEASVAKLKSAQASLNKSSKSSFASSEDLEKIASSIAVLGKRQVEFVKTTEVAALRKALEELASTQKSVDARATSEVKSLRDDITSLKTNIQETYASKSALQTLDVSSELKSLEAAIAGLSKDRDSYATATQLKLLDAQVKALGTQKGSKVAGLFKRDADTATLKKDLKAIETTLASLTKSQGAFATSAQLKELVDAVDALRKSSSGYASSDVVETLKVSMTELTDKTKSGSSLASKDVRELEQQVMERIEGYINTIPKDTSMKLKKHIEKAATLWFADRTGRQDFALSTGGGRVVGHSQLTPFVARGDGPLMSAVSFLRSGVHPKSDEWMLTPSMEQPGDCLALHGSYGYVDVRLRQPVKVDAVTLEHTNSLNAYDMHSAPRDIQIFGWYAHGNNCKHSKPPKSLIAMGNYTYHTAGDSVQSFEVSAPHTVDHVRLIVKNNHGHARWTCIYRFRVHGIPSS